MRSGRAASPLQDGHAARADRPPTARFRTNSVRKRPTATRCSTWTCWRASANCSPPASRSVWDYSLEDGPGMRSAIAYHFPFIADRTMWPFRADAHALHRTPRPARKPAVYRARLPAAGVRGAMEDVAARSPRARRSAHAAHPPAAAVGAAASTPGLSNFALLLVAAPPDSMRVACRGPAAVAPAAKQERRPARAALPRVDPEKAQHTGAAKSHRG